MFKGFVIVEDIVLDARRVNITKDTPEVSETWRWDGTSTDLMSGRSVEFSLTDEQWAAMLWLAISQDSDDPGSRVNRSFRDDAREAVADWPKECRPFP